MTQRAAPRKRRDSLADTMGAPQYTEDPDPPYIFVVRPLIWCCFDIDRARLQPFLPPDLTLADGAPGFLGIYGSDPLGWGLTNLWGSFLSVAVNDYPGPDTAEANFTLSGFAPEPARRLLEWHYQRTYAGRSAIRQSGDEIMAELTDDAGCCVLRCHIRLQPGAHGNMTSLDRYLALDRRGDLVSYLISVDGDSQAAELLGLEFTGHAPPEWQAAQPTRLEWATFVPQMLTHQAQLLPLRPGPAGADPGGSGPALMALFDAQGRACAILSEGGEVLHLNATARLIAARLGASLPAALPRGDRPRLMAALAAAARGRAGDTGAGFRLQAPGEPLLILHLAPLDPVLAGPGRVLLLIDDPWAPRSPPSPDLLQLLGLTPAEARIAGAVGVGLPPREAALRLGLTESTVRSSLKVIYDKLGVARQSELARIVARLETH